MGTCEIFSASSDKALRYTVQSTGIRGANSHSKKFVERSTDLIIRVKSRLSTNRSAVAMPSFFSRLKGRDGPSKISKGKKDVQQADLNDAPAKPSWDDAWTRKTVDPSEVQELLRGCTLELKSRGRNMTDLLAISGDIDYARCHRGAFLAA